MDSRADRAARHVIAIGALLGKTVLAIVVEESDGQVAVVTPAEVRFQVLDLLRHLDWNGAYYDEAERQDRP